MSTEQCRVMLVLLRHTPLGEVEPRLVRGFLCHNDVLNKDDVFLVI